jgi:hypothetical protein
MQIVFDITGYLIFSLLSFVVSIIGDLMTFQCIFYLWKFVLNQDRLE